MAGQDWFDKDFYATLGVPKQADAATIKKAYRKLARTTHPDANPGDAAAEERFKEIGEAYAVLTDPEQRQQYDAIRAMAGGGARFAAGPGGGGGRAGGFEDMFSGMFGGGTRVRYSGGGADFDLNDILSSLGGGGRFGSSQFGGGQFGGGYGAPAGRRGQDLTAGVTLPFRDAVEGSTVSLDVNGRSLTARIPAGVHDGQKIRLRGKGGPGASGGPAGDLILSVQVTPHPVFAIDGANLRLTVPVTFAEAALGATVEVPTYGGGNVRLKVPAGTASGTTLRAKGRGIKVAKTTGDLLVTIQVAVPKKLSQEAKRAIEALAAASDDAVRTELYAKAGDPTGT